MHNTHTVEYNRRRPRTKTKSLPSTAHISINLSIRVLVPEACGSRKGEARESEKCALSFRVCWCRRIFTYIHTYMSITGYCITGVGAETNPDRTPRPRASRKLQFACARVLRVRVTSFIYLSIRIVCSCSLAGQCQCQCSV